VRHDHITTTCTRCEQTRSDYWFVGYDDGDEAHYGIADIQAMLALHETAGVYTTKNAQLYNYFWSSLIWGKDFVSAQGSYLRSLVKVAVYIESTK